MSEKIEFIKVKGPSKYKMLVDTSSGQNIGVDLTRKEMRSAFFNIKNLLEDQTNLSEPARASGAAKKIVVNEVTNESVLEFLLNQEPDLVSDIILSYRNNISEIPDHSPETKKKIQKFICGVEEEAPEVGKLKPRKPKKKIKWKRIFRWIGILALAGIAAGHALGHYDIIDVYFSVIEYIKVNFGNN